LLEIGGPIEQNGRGQPDLGATGKQALGHVLFAANAA